MRGVGLDVILIPGGTPHHRGVHKARRVSKENNFCDNSSLYRSGSLVRQQSATDVNRYDCVVHPIAAQS